jgi:hypothetical protein
MELEQVPATPTLQPGMETQQTSKKPDDDERLQQLQSDAKEAPIAKVGKKVTFEIPGDFKKQIGKLTFNVKGSVEITIGPSSRTLQEQGSAGIDRVRPAATDVKQTFAVHKLEDRCKTELTSALLGVDSSFNLFGNPVPIDFKLFETKVRLDNLEKPVTSALDLWDLVPEVDLLKVSTGVMIPPSKLEGIVGGFFKVEVSLPLKDNFSPEEIDLLRSTSKKLDALKDELGKHMDDIGDFQKAADGRTKDFKKLLKDPASKTRIRKLRDGLRDLRNKLADDDNAKIARPLVRKILQSMMKSRVTRAAAKVALATLKVLSRAVPVIGWALLVYDLFEAGYYIWNIYRGNFIFDPTGQGEEPPGLIGSLFDDSQSTDGDKQPGGTSKEPTQGDGTQTDGTQTDGKQTDKQTKPGTDGLTEEQRERLEDRSTPAGRLVQLVLLRDFGDRAPPAALLRLLELVSKYQVTDEHVELVRANAERMRGDPHETLDALEKILQRPAITGTKKGDQTTRTQTQTQTQTQTRESSETETETETEKTSSTDKTGGGGTNPQLTTGGGKGDRSSLSLVDEQGPGKYRGTTPYFGSFSPTMTDEDFADICSAAYEAEFLDQTQPGALANFFARLGIEDKEAFWRIQWSMWNRPRPKSTTTTQDKQTTKQATTTGETSSESSQQTSDLPQPTGTSTGLTTEQRKPGDTETSVRIVDETEQTGDGDSETEEATVKNATTWNGPIGSETVMFDYTFKLGRIYPPDMPARSPAILYVTNGITPVRLPAVLVAAKKVGMAERLTGIELIEFTFQTLNNAPVNVGTKAKPIIVTPGLTMKTTCRWSPNWFDQRKP